MLPLADIPAPAAGTVETWLYAAAAVVGLVVLVKQAFGRKPPIEVDLDKLRRENDEKVEKLRSETLGLFAVNTQSHAKIDEKVRDAENLSVKIANEIRAEMKQDRESAEGKAQQRIQVLSDRMNTFAENMPLKLIEHLQRLGLLKTPS